MKIILLVFYISTLVVAGHGTQSVEDEFQGVNYRNEFSNKIYVNDFFSKAETLLNKNTKYVGSRGKRLLASPDFSELIEFIQKIIQKIKEQFSGVDLSLGSFFSQIDKRKLVILESTTTIVLGILLAVFNPASALFGTVLYYLFLGLEAAVTLIHRLYQDDEFFTMAARRLGAEGFSDEVLENIGSALFTVADFYNFLSNLQS